MKCKSVQEKLIDYLNQELSFRDTQKIAEHLKQCAVCSRELQELKSVLALTQEFQLETCYPYPSEDFLIQVRHKIKNLQPKPKVLPRLIPVFASAMILLVVIIATYIVNTKKMPTASEDQLFTELKPDIHNVTYLYEHLDTKTQELINDQMIAEVLSDEVKQIDRELIFSAEPIDLFSQLSNDEKEDIVNQLLKKYLN
ncbi:MAG: zf-HC2 domain-containing protein [candidate division WOR-3 bacterium]